jgi:predicted site-specific integrase-resolvase
MASYRMKLSEYARQVGVTDKTADQWWRAGQLDAYHLPMGTIIVREPKMGATGAALYARVSSAEQKDDVTRQMQRLRAYAAARGYAGLSGGGRSDRDRLWPQRRAAQAQAAAHRCAVGALVVEHRDRLTRFGDGSIATLVEHEGRRVEAIFPTDYRRHFGKRLRGRHHQPGRPHLWPAQRYAARRSNSGRCQAV